MAFKRKRGQAKLKGSIKTADQTTFQIVWKEAEKPFKGKPNAKKRKLSTATTPSVASSEDGFQFNVDLKAQGRIEIHPKNTWESLDVYGKFVVENVTFQKGDIVEVNWDESNLASNLDEDEEEPKAWIARVLEIRASDASHVYLRVAWFYWPDQLPMGAQYYHGVNEVIESNHADIIDAMTVLRKAEISRWDENDDTADLTGQYYRQWFDYPSRTLSVPRVFCKCRRHQNPDLTIVHCPSCDTWLHEACILSEAQSRHDKKHLAEKAAEKAKSLAVDAARSKNKRIDDADIIELTRDKTSVKVVMVKFKESKLRIKQKEGYGDTSGSGSDIIEEDIRCLECHEIIP